MSATTAASAATRPVRALRRALMRGSAIAAGAFVTVPAAAQLAPGTLPQVRDPGGATIETTGTRLLVNLNARNRVITYDSFNVAADSRVSFVDGVDEAPLLSVLNRLDANRGASLIEGGIDSDPNITVWLINPDGITFGPTGSFAGGSLLVSTLPLDEGQQSGFLAGTLTSPRLMGSSAGGITFVSGSGLIAASGSVIAVAQTIDVGKEIRSSSGSIALVAATDVTFTTGVNSPLGITINKGTTLAAVEGGGPDAGIDISGKLTGQSLRVVGGVDQAITAALLNVRDGAELTATAANGSIILATTSTTADNGDVVITNGLSSTGSPLRPGIVSRGTVSASARDESGNVIVPPGVDIRMASAGELALGGTIAASRHLVLTAGGNVSSGGSLVARSNSDGLGGGDLTIDAGQGLGNITLDGASQLIAGTEGERADVRVRGQAIALGNVTARSLASIGMDTLTGSSIRLGDVTLTDAINVVSSSGDLTTGSIRVGGDIRLTAQGGADIRTGALQSAGLVRVAGDVVNIASATSSGAGINVIARELSLAAGTASAAAGRIDLQVGELATIGTLLAGDAAGPDLRGEQITIRAGRLVLGSAIARNGHVALTSSGDLRAGTLRAGSGTSASDVLVSAAGAVAIEGDVTASRTYAVTGANVILGTAEASATQVAAGETRITATSGSIAGRGNLTLASDGDATGGEALTLRLSAPGQMVDFAPTTILNGGSREGPAGREPSYSADVIVDGAGTVTLGQVNARRLRTGDSATDFVVPGAVRLGNVQVARGLTVTSANGSIITGTVTVRDNGEGIALNAGGDGSDISTQALRTSAGDIRLSARDSLSLAPVDGDAATGRTVALLAGGAISAGGRIVASEDIALRSGTTATLAALEAGDDIDLQAGGDLFLVSARTTGTGENGRATLFDPSQSGASAAIDIRGDTASGSNITITAASLSGPPIGGDTDAGLVIGDLTAGSLERSDGSAAIIADAGDIRIGRVTARSGDITVTAGLGSVSGLRSNWSAASGGGSNISAVGDVRFNVSGALTAGSVQGSTVTNVASLPGSASVRIRNVTARTLDLQARTDLQVDGGSVEGLATLRTTGGNAGPRSLVDASLIGRYGAANLTAAGSGASISVTTSNGVAQLGTVNAGQSIAVSAQALDVQDAVAASGALTFTVSRGRLGLGTGSAGTAATLVKEERDGNAPADGATSDRIEVRTSLAGSSVSVRSETDAVLASATARTGDLTVNAARDLSVANGSATAGAVVLLAGRDASLTAAAAEDMAVTAGRNAALGALAAADNVVVSAGGDIVAARVTSSGGGTDNRTFALAPDLAGRETAVAAGPTNAADGSVSLVAGGNVRIGTVTSSAGAASLTARQGDITGLAASEPQAGFGRGDIRVNAAGQSVRLRAEQGAIRLGAISAGDAAGSASTGNQIDVVGRAVDLTSAAAANGGLLLNATAGDVAIGTGSARTSVVLTATRNATGGSLTASGGGIGVTAGPLARFDALTASEAITGIADTIEVGRAVAGGALALTARTNGLILGTGSAGSTATLRKQGAADGLTVQTGLTANGDILLESEGQIAIGGKVEATGDRLLTIRNTGTTATTIGGTGEAGGFALADAEMDFLNASRIVVDSRTRNLTFRPLTIEAATGRRSLHFLSTGAVTIAGSIAGAGTGLLQIGGAGTDEPSGLVAPATLAQSITLDIGNGAGGAGIDFAGGTVDLRAQKIVFGRSELIQQVAALDSAGVAREVANGGSPLYQGDISRRDYLKAKLLRVSYSDHALFQNTGGPAGGGVVLNGSTTPTTSHLALQLFSTGDRANNSFALFGNINGFIGRAAGILPSQNLEFATDSGSGRVLRITQSSSRVNGCVIGSPDRGCLVTDPPRPGLSIYEGRQIQLFGATENPDLLFNPLVGRGNEGLFVDIADAPVGIDTLQCQPGEENCPRSEEPK